MTAGWAMAIFACIVFVIGTSQIALAVRCHLYFAKAAQKARLPRALPFDPSVTLICPCKGLDPTFEQNVRSMLSLDYPNYQTVFVMSDPGDPAGRALQPLVADRPRCRIVSSETSHAIADKNRNLLAAVDTPEARSSNILAFIDSDVNPKPGWLRVLVLPLIDPEVGMATGYRRYLPGRGFWTAMRAVGNNVAMAPYMVGDRLPAAWGGSMALRRVDFDRSGARDIWRTTLDDDLTLATAIRRTGLRIEFVPDCMTISSDECTMSEYYEWLKRHFFFVRLYSPALWIGAFVSFVPMFAIFTGLALAAGSIVFPALLLPALALLAAAPPQIAGGLATALVFEDRPTARWVPLGMFCSGATAVAAFFASAFLRRLTWRGITYEIMGTSVTAVVRPAPKEVHR